VYEALFNDWKQSDVDTEQHSEHDRSQRHVVAAVVTVEHTV